jgi:meso-butanediol dehydrogenase/(S,S)-butanediol dehydrogenase/diacetyl reductase
MHNDKRLSDKVAIITGAANGIGAATGVLFAQKGAKVVLADVNTEKLKKVLDRILAEGGTGVIKKTDVAIENDIKELVSFTLDTYSKIDILCNNAGITGDLENIHDQKGDNWLNVYNVNVLGAVYATKHVALHMQERQQGSIVNTASVAGIRAGAGPNAYSASKAALINFTQTAACDLGASQVRVNVVCPGLTKTNMTQPFFDYAIEKGKEKKLGNRCELQRYCLPEEIAYAILFFAGDESSFITGQALAVDGGNTASLNMPGMKF